MKRCLLNLLLFTSVSVGFAQTHSDDPVYQQQNPSKGIPNFTTYGHHYKATVQGNVLNACDSGVAVISATGCDFIWSTDSTMNNVISYDDSLTTGMLYDDTTFYLTEVMGDSLNLMSLPNHSTNYSGNVRGYYFTAPSDFIVTGLRVPTEASTGAQNIAILRFNAGPPPLYSAVTNDFDVLGYWANYTLTDTIKVCFAIDSGDVIGIYGNRDDVNSYGAAPATTSINGLPVTLTRSGMQLPLSSNPMANVWSESGSSISRVEMYYDMVGNDTLATEAVQVTVPKSFSASSAISVCAGDSALIFGNYFSVDTTIVDSALTVLGCDSLNAVQLTINPIYQDTMAVQICQGDSLLIGGQYYSAVGFASDSTVSLFGCDSVMVSDISIIPAPTVSVGSFSPDTICLQGGVVALPAGTPAGGTYTGPGVVLSDLDPSISGTGTHTITYSFTDGNSCTSTATADVTVFDCTGIETEEAGTIKVFPNPFSNQINLEFDQPVFNNVQMIDAIGKVVLNMRVDGQTNVTLPVSQFASGAYTLIIKSDDSVQTIKVVK